MQKISPSLWFDNNAEEAANFYVSTFSDIVKDKESRVINSMRYGKAGAMAANRPEGSVMMVTFLLAGEHFSAINGGKVPGFEFPGATSFVINCENQAEVDKFWERLSAEGGKTSQCGWLTDKFGVPWQVVPTALGRLMAELSPDKGEQVMSAMLGMTKLNIKDLEEAARK